jgi:hypothetical protein
VARREENSAVLTPLVELEPHLNAPCEDAASHASPGPSSCRSRC